MSGYPPADASEWIRSQEGAGADTESSKCRRRVAAQIEGIVTRLAVPLCRRPVTADHPDMEQYARRVWNCVEWHWRGFAEKHAVPFQEAIRRLEAGTLVYGQVRANLMYEVTLAEALERGENRAAEAFERDYMPYVRSIAGRVGGYRGIDHVDNFAAELLVSRVGHPPRIATYRGRTPLAHWLRAVVANFLVTQARRPRLKVIATPLDKPCDDNLASSADGQDCEQLLRPVLEAAASSIETQDRLLLQMLVLDRVPQKELAEALKLNSGTVTRRRQRAAAAIFSEVRDLIERSSKRVQARECLELILAGGQEPLRDRLAEILAGAVRRGAVPSNEGAGDEL